MTDTPQAYRDEVDKPDFTKNLSRWNYDHWGRRYGLPNALGATQSSVLSAMATALPNVEMSVDRIAWLAGVTPRTVQRAMRELKRVGAINYDPNAGGRHHRYQIAMADVRQKTVVEHIIKMAKGCQNVTVTDASNGDTVSSFNSAKGDIVTPKGDSLSSKGDIETSKGRQNVTRSTQGKDANKNAREKSANGATGVAISSQASPVVKTDSKPTATSVEQPTNQPKVPTVEQSTTKPKVTPESPPLSDEERERVLSSAEHVKHYLLFGREGLRVEDPFTLPPSSGHWAQHYEVVDGKVVDTHEAKWTPAQFAAFYWWRVCVWRESVGRTLTMPYFSRGKSTKGKEMRKLMDGVNAHVDDMGKSKAFQYVCLLTQWFTLIRWKLGKAGAAMTLDVGSISHGLVKPLVLEMMTWTESRFDDEWEKMAKAKDKQGLPTNG